MKKLFSFACSICCFMSFSLSAAAVDVCMEGYDNGAGQCVIFDRETAPAPQGINPAAPVPFGSGIKQYSFAAPSINLTTPDSGGIYYRPKVSNSGSEYPYDDYDTLDGSPLVGAAPPQFWCNVTHSDSAIFPQPATEEGVDGDYGWSYTNAPGICKVLTLLKNGDDDVLTDEDRIFDDSYTYDWILPSYFQMFATKAEPSSRVELGIAQSKIYTNDIPSIAAADLNAMLDEIASSGVKIIRIAMDKVPLSPNTSVAEFDELIDAIALADTKGIDVVVGVNIFGNVGLDGYYSGNTAVLAACKWTGMRSVKDWNSYTHTYNSVAYQFEDHMTFALQRFVAADLDNIVGIELGNELDTVCYNADVPFTTTSEPAMEVGSGKAFSDSANAYAGLLVKTRNVIDSVYQEATPPKLITFGMTFSYRSWHVKCDPDPPYNVTSLPSWCPNYDANNPSVPLQVPLQLTAWDAVNYLAQAFISPNYASVLPNDSSHVDVIGYHFYPGDDVDGDLTDIYYPGINPTTSYPMPVAIGGFMSQTAVNFFNKDAWLTEWGFKKEGPWPGPQPFYSKDLRYRSMIEVMEHLNTDASASKIKKAFLYSFYSPDGYEIGSLDLVNNTAAYQMPESRVVKLYANTLSGNCTNQGGWTNPCDSDNDGIVDTSDALPLSAAASVDTDGDGMPDSWNAGCNSACQGGSGLTLDNDNDDDGITNVLETELEMNPLLIDSDSDGLTDEWEQQQLDGYTPAIDAALPDVADTRFEYFRFYFSSNDALLAYPAHETGGHDNSIPECELAIHVIKPINWSKRKVMIEYPGGHWATRDSTDSGTGHQAGDYPAEVLGDYSDYLSFVVNWRSPGSDRNCTETGDDPTTWEELVRDAQEAMYHIVLTIPEFLDPEDDYPAIYLLGGSAGGHLVTMMAVHGLDQLEIADWIIDISKVPVGRSVMTRVLSINGPTDFARLRSECEAYNLDSGNLEYNRTLAVPTPDHGGPGIPIVETIETIPDTMQSVDRLFNGVEISYDSACDIESHFMTIDPADEFLLYHQLGAWYHPKYSPGLLLTQGTGDGIVPPEMAIGTCTDIATHYDGNVTFESSVSMNSLPGAANPAYVEQFYCGSPMVRMDLARDVGHMLGGAGYGTSSNPVDSEGYLRQLREWMEGNLFDTDSDGIEDNWEMQHFESFGFNPESDGGDDGDGDGLTNLEEYTAFTDPLDADTDDDNVPDGSDAYPLIGVASVIDVDEDGAPGVCDSACEASGMLADNCTEAANPLQLDLDLDGYGNACDGDVTNDDVVGIADMRELIANGLGAWVSNLFGNLPATTLPHINKTVSEINQSEMYQWAKEGSAYTPGPSGLSCAGTIPCPTE